MEALVLDKIASVLRIPSSTIDLETSFIQNGGDSLKATSLSSSVRAIGVKLTRESILTCCTIRELLRNLEAPLPILESPPPSMQSSVTLPNDEWHVISQVSNGIKTPASNDASTVGGTITSSSSSSVSVDETHSNCAENDTPVPKYQYQSGSVKSPTHLQLSLIHGTLKDHRTNIITYTTTHYDHDLPIIKEAWRKTIEAEDIFSTDWIECHTGQQNSVFEWNDSTLHDKDIQESSIAEHACVGSHFTVTRSEKLNGKDCSNVTWTVHHAFIDGFSGYKIMDKVLKYANNLQTESSPSFWAWAQDLEHYQALNSHRAKDFWRLQNEAHQNAKGHFSLPERSSPQDTASQRIMLDVKHLHDNLAAAAKSCNVTLPTVFYAAWALVLSSFVDSDDIVFGAILSGRNIPVPSSDKVIGPLVNPLPLHVRIEKDKTIKDLLVSIFRSLLDLEQFSWTTPEHGFSRGYDSAMSIETWESDWEDLAIRPLRSETRQENDVPFGISITAKLDVQFQYNECKIPTENARRIVSSYEAALSQMVRTHTTVDAAMEDILTNDSRTVLKRYGNCFSGRTTRESINDDLVTLYEKVVREHPEAIAVDDGKLQLSYSQFNLLASKVAMHLSTKIAKGDVVCVHSDKSIYWIVAIFGILKSGGVYCSLDTALPPNLRASMYKIAGAKVFLTPYDSQLCATPSTSENFASVESILNTIPDNEVSWSPREVPEPSSSAYICFTSGSTGTPKGVTCSHEGLVAFQSDLEVRLFAQPGVRISQIMSVAFDGSIHEIFSALTYGATLVLQSGGDPFGPLETSNAAILTPSIARVLNPEDYPSLKWVYLVGEPVPQVVSDRWSFVKQLYNMYGPTEGTCGATIRRLRPGEPVTIGAPNPTTRVYILDSRGRLAQPGMVGEIYLAGVQVARGYIGLEKETKERFLIDNIARNGEKMYRTGDRGYWSTNGEVVCLGRNDRQIKLRGYRLDLNDLEIRIAKADPSLTGVALARRDDELVAMVEPASVDMAKHKALISSALPRYALPHHIVAVEQIPMTSAGKVDYVAVSKANEYAKAVVELPTTSTEHLVAEAFRKVLDLLESTKVIATSEFLLLGGHSLKQMRLARYLSDKTGVRIPLRLVIANPTVRGVAAAIDALTVEGSIGADMKLGIENVSPIETEWLRKYAFSNGTASFNVCFAGSFEQDKVDLALLSNAWNMVLQRHAILRSRYRLQDNGAYRRGVSSSPPKVDILEDFDVWTEANRPFAVDHQSPVRVFLSKSKFMIVLSHIVADYTTLSLLLQDAATIYNGGNFTALPLSYGDTKAWVEAVPEMARAFWTEYLANLPPAPPLIQETPRRPSYQGKSSVTVLDANLAQAIFQFSKTRAVTPQQLALAAMALYLEPSEGGSDVVIGVPYLNRRCEEDLNTVGLFLEPLPVRITYSAANSETGQTASAPSYLQAIKCSLQQALANAVPWNLLLDACGIERKYPDHPLFDVMVTFLDHSMMGQLHMNVPSFEPCYLWSQGAKFKLMVEFLAISRDKLAMRIEYDNSCIASEEVDKMAAALPAVLHMLIEGKLDYTDMKRELARRECQRTRTDSPDGHTMFGQRLCDI